MYRWFLAVRYLLKRPINVLGMLGVMVGVWALIVVVSIFSGFIEEVRRHVRSATADLSVFRLPWPTRYSELEDVIRNDPNVAGCAPRLVWYGLLHSFGATHEVVPRVRALDRPGADSRFVSLIGIDPEQERDVTGLTRWLEQVAEREYRVDDPSRALAPAEDGRPAILISERRLTRAEFVRPGQTVKVTAARIEGFGRGQALKTVERKFVVAGAYATKHGGFDNANVLVPIGVLRDLLAEGRGDVVTEASVRCRDPSLGEETAERLQARLQERLGSPEVLVMTWEQRNAAFLGAVDHQRSLMKLVLFVIMVVAGFLMYATLSMMVTEKTHDIGIITAMGGTRPGVLQVFLICGLTLTVIGTVLGVISGCLSSIYLDDFNKWIRANFGVDLFPTRIYNLKRVPYDLDPLWINQVVLMALAVGTLVSGIPAWRASRHDPMRALRNE